MNARLILAVLQMRRQHRRRERWTPSAIESFRSRSLAELRTFALEHSEFYRRLHRGLEHEPLEELPVVTKSDLMGSFDELVTDSRIRIRNVESYLAARQG